MRRRLTDDIEGNFHRLALEAQKEVADARETATRLWRSLSPDERRGYANDLTTSLPPWLFRPADPWTPSTPLSLLAPPDDAPLFGSNGEPVTVTELHHNDLVYDYEGNEFIWLGDD